MNYLKPWTLTGIATVCIVTLSLIPIPEDPPLEGVPFIDKWVHFVMYGGIVGAIWLDKLLHHTTCNNVVWAAGALLYATAIGGLMELIQNQTSYRSGDWIDFLADIFGAVLATLICIPLYKFCAQHLLKKDNLSC